MDHILSELSTMTCLSWVALHSVAHGARLSKSLIQFFFLFMGGAGAASILKNFSQKYWKKESMGGREIDII